MLPTLSIGALNISSFGLFLAAGFLFGVFLVWRLARAWDLNEEKILDLTLLTFLGGLIGARIYFILENFPLFGADFLKWIFFHKYQGFSFWGAILGGFLALRFFAKKFKINFWQVADIACVGFLGGLIFASLGCFFGGCEVGAPSKFFALQMVGTVGKRIPVQLFEAALFSFALWRIWRGATHFHIQGTIASIALICIGLIKVLMEPLKDTHRQDIFFNLVLVAFGINIFYKFTKRKLLADLSALGTNLVNIIKDPSSRKSLVVHLKKSWYNYKVNFSWKIRQLSKILRRLNVRFYHKDSKYY